MGFPTILTNHMTHCMEAAAAAAPWNRRSLEQAAMPLERLLPVVVLVVAAALLANVTIIHAGKLSL